MQTLPVLATSAGWVSTVRMPFTVADLPGVRRRLLAEALRNDVARSTAYDAEIVLAELVTNSLSHARPLDGGLQVAWGCWDGRLHIHVTDGGSPERPAVQEATSTATRGRGLSIVRQLAQAWGVRVLPSATTVWATLALPQLPAPSREPTAWA